MRRHLAQSGHVALVREVEKAAVKSGAPFLAANAPLAEARVRWLQAFDDASVLACDASGQDEGFRRLKVGRYALRRATKPRRIGKTARTRNLTPRQALYFSPGWIDHPLRLETD